MIYYNNCTVEKAHGSFTASEIRTLTREEIDRLAEANQVLPVAEIRFERRGGRVSRPRKWVS